MRLTPQSCVPPTQAGCAAGSAGNCRFSRDSAGGARDKDLWQRKLRNHAAPRPGDRLRTTSAQPDPPAARAALPPPKGRKNDQNCQPYTAPPPTRCRNTATAHQHQPGVHPAYQCPAPASGDRRRPAQIRIISPFCHELFRAGGSWPRRRALRSVSRSRPSILKAAATIYLSTDAVLRRAQLMSAF